MTVRQAVLELKRLMEKWGLSINDWSLILHYADILNGYDIKYNRDSHLHIIIPMNKIPWTVKEMKANQETMPPEKSKFSRDFNDFIEKTGWDFHTLVGDPKYFGRFLKNGTRLININNQKIRIATVIGNLRWGFIHFTQYAKKTSPEVMARRLAWRQLIYNEALKKQDKQVALEAKKLLDRFNLQEKKFFNNQKQASKNFETKGYLKGQTAFPGKVKGKVLLITNPDRVVKKVKKDFILVSKLTSPKLILQLKSSKAIVTDEGGQLSHAAIFCREFNIPGVIGTLIATQTLKNGELIEVDATRGVVRKLKK